MQSKKCAQFRELFFILIFLFSVANASQFDDKNALPEIKFTQLSTEDGLSITSISDIDQDQTGYMWFATLEGLNRYDGYNFSIFKHNSNDSTSIADNKLLSLYEDSQGRLWCGTINGFLSRYEPQTMQFENYPLNPPLLSTLDMDVIPSNYPLPYSFYLDNSVTDITEDVHGNLWLATWGAGVAVFNPEKESFIYCQSKHDEQNGLTSNRIMALAKDSSGVMWIGTFGSGLNRYNTKLDIFEEYQREPSTMENNVRFSWYHHDPKNPRSLSDDRVTEVYFDSKQSLWVGTFVGGLNRVTKQERFDAIHQPRGLRFERFVHDSDNINSLSNNNILAIHEDEHNRMWIGTFGGGLNCMDATLQHIKRFENDPADSYSISQNDITALFEDEGGVLWIGTHLGKGINKFAPNLRKFTHIKKDPLNPNSLNDNIVWALAEDRFSNGESIWVGTYKGGLNKYNRKSGQVEHIVSDANNTRSLSHNHIRSVLCDRRGNLWVGTYSNGLDRALIGSPEKSRHELIAARDHLLPRDGFVDAGPHNTLNFKHYNFVPNKPGSISSNQIRGLLETQNGEIWVCTFGGGLNRYQRESDDFTAYRHIKTNPASLPDDRVYTIIEAKNGMLWIGSFGGGIAAFNPKTEEFVCYRKIPGNKHSLSDNRTLALLEDHAGNIWVGTEGGGLNQLEIERGIFHHYGQRRGLNDEVVYGILEDENHNLWLSTNSGLYKYDRGTNTFHVFDESHGLQSQEFSGGAVCKTSDGAFLFGGINGFNLFDPEQVTFNPHVPSVVITSFKKYNQSVPIQDQHIRLSHNDNFFSFEFAALDFTNPRKNKYKYQLAGVDKGWVETDAGMRSAYYTNLDPGEYTFFVKGCNSDGIWNNRPTAISVSIDPPFYRQAWFYVLFTTLAVSVALVLHRMQVRQSVQRQVELERIRHAENERVRKQVAEDFHDEFGHKLSGITLYIELLKRGMLQDQEKVGNYLDKMAEISRNLSVGMRNFIWTLDPEVDSFYDFAFHMKDYGDHYFNKKGVAFWVNGIEEHQRDVQLPMQWRQQLTFIFKEWISKLHDYIDPQNVTMHFSASSTEFSVSLHADGQINLEKNPDADDIILTMKKRVDKIKASFNYELNDKSGLSLNLSGALPNALSH